VKAVSVHNSTLITRVLHSAALSFTEVQGAERIDALFGLASGARFRVNVASFNGLSSFRGLIR
jgi:hypothetical protein